MGLRISTNIASINAQRQLSANQAKLDHSLKALSSGSRIVNASDDAAGLAISENLRGQIAGLKMARNNAYNATSLVEVAEGGLNEVTNIMVRLRELGVQAASDNISDVERKFLDEEAQLLIEEADRIAKTTRFGDQVLLDGSGSGEKKDFHVGPFASENDVISFSIDANMTRDNLDYGKISMIDKGEAKSSLQTVDDTLIEIGKARASFGAIQSRLNMTVSNLDIQHENLASANSRLRDADVAHETAQAASAQILQQAAVGVLAQANQSKNSAMRLIG